MNSETHISNVFLTSCALLTNQLTADINFWLHERPDKSELLIRAIIAILSKSRGLPSWERKFESSVLMRKSILYSLDSKDAPYCLQVLMMLKVQYLLFKAITKKLNIAPTLTVRHTGVLYPQYDWWLCEAVSRSVKRDMAKENFFDGAKPLSHEMTVEGVGKAIKAYEAEKPITEVKLEKYRMECPACRKLLMLMESRDANGRERPQ